MSNSSIKFPESKVFTPIKSISSSSLSNLVDPNAIDHYQSNTKSMVSQSPKLNRQPYFMSQNDRNSNLILAYDENELTDSYLPPLNSNGPASSNSHSKHSLSSLKGNGKRKSLQSLAKNTSSRNLNAGANEVATSLRLAQKELDAGLQTLSKAEDNLWKSKSSLLKLDKSKSYGSDINLSKYAKLGAIGTDSSITSDEILNDPLGNTMIFPKLDEFEGQVTTLPPLSKASKFRSQDSVNDVTSRLSNPANYTAAHKAKIEAIRNHHASYQTSNKPMGSTNNLSSKANSMSSIARSKNNLNEPEVFERLMNDAKNKQLKSSSQKIDFTGYPSGYKPPSDSDKEHMRSALLTKSAMDIFTTTPQHSQPTTPNKTPRESVTGVEKRRTSVGIVGDVAAPPPPKAIAPIEPQRKVPIYSNLNH
ncbi:hypothetical protein BC833DRAFT_595380 [Globomyces pollinis-pini]|nr:hypothetical protein BC833DRAFT_595380 [Globomyces pollinis-pini]